MILTNIVLGCAFLAIGGAMTGKARMDAGESARTSRRNGMLFYVAGGLFFIAAAIRAATE